MRLLTKSINVDTVFPGTLIGERPAWLPTAVFDACRGVVESGEEQTLQAEIAGAGLTEVHCFTAGGMLFCEIELNPGTSPDPGVSDALLMVAEAFKKIDDAKSVAELAAVITSAVREVSGFERVLVYRFDADGCGDVLGESLAAEWPQSFLGLRFPASDIPLQARDMFRQTSERWTPTRDYDPIPLVPGADPQGQPFDLSLSRYRSVSPLHRMYQKNIDADGSMSISVMQDGALWGLVIGHHRHPYRVGAATRHRVAALVRAFGMKLTALFETHRRGEVARAIDGCSAMVGKLAAADDFIAALSHGQPSITDLFPACTGGAVVWVEDGELRSRTLGDVPPVEELVALTSWIRSQSEAPVFSTACLSAGFPRFVPYREIASGLLALTFQDDRRPVLLLFRPEIVQSVSWAGKPGKLVGDDGAVNLPRQSFDQWVEIKRGQSLSWQPWELDVAKTVCATVNDVIVRQSRRFDDLDAEKRRFESFAQTELAIAAVAFESQEPMVVTDPQEVILRVNRAFLETTGYTAAEVVGQTPRLFKSDRHGADFYRAMWQSLSSTGTWSGEVWDRRKNGEIYPKWLTITAVKNDVGAVTHYVATHTDTSDRKKAEAKIQDLAFFDQLTGLPNRTLLLDRMKQAITASCRNGSYCGALFVDLDNFRTINDTLGHEMGDQLLKEAAQRLSACVRDDDTVARLGGDDFLLMLVGLSPKESDAATQVETVGEKILAALNQPYLIDGFSHHCTPSIGATLFQGHVSTEDVFKQTDLAMYRAKTAGRNTFRFFDPEMETVVMARAALEKDLREALQSEQFLLHYQAQVAGERGIEGVEALVRWQHPQRGMVSPADFIPLAEETGLILPLGKWVLKTACAQLAAWAARPNLAGHSIAVNVSAYQFQQCDFVDQVIAVLDATGANPERLKLELTESLLVKNVEDVIEKMFALKAIGVSFSLDDFGTGYSSLSYLKRLPLDQLKIDQSFVRDVLSDPNDAVIAKAIVALAQSLGLGVIAEGVETAEQRDFLARSGCHAYQGYFYSRPLPIDAFEQFALQGRAEGQSCCEVKSL